MRNSLYPYQNKLVEESLKRDIGFMILPTASGKGVICREVIYKMVGSSININNQFVGLVFTPRLLLNKQWLNDFINYFEGSEHPINVIIVGSDKMTNDERQQIEEKLEVLKGEGNFSAPQSTMSSNELKKIVDENKRNGINTIVISTYHSNGVVRHSGIYFDCSIFDEAQYIPGREAQDSSSQAVDEFINSTEVMAAKKIFATATPKIGNHDEEDGEYLGRGMNNKEIYGEEIFGWIDDKTKKPRRISPRDLVEAGYILEPRVCVVTDDDLDDYEITNIKDIDNIISSRPIGQKKAEEVAKITIKSFFRHREELKKESSFPKKIGAKALVVCDGITELRGIQNSKALREFTKENPEISINFISSDFESGIKVHGQDNMRYSNKSKKSFLEYINSLSSEKDVLIFHIDMLTCGIDVHLLTGVIFFKQCHIIKLLQNIGRAARLHQEDRINCHIKNKIYAGGTGWIKPSFHIVLPLCKENIADFVNFFKRTIKNLRDNYDFKTSEFVHIGGRPLEPGTVNTEMGSALENSLRQLTGEADREYFLYIEEAKHRKEERKISSLASQIKELREKGDWEGIAQLREKISRV